MGDPVLGLMPWALICTLAFFVLAFIVPLKTKRTQELFHGRGHLRVMGDLFAAVMVALVLLRLAFHGAWVVKLLVVPVALVGELVGLLTFLAIRTRWARSQPVDRKLQIVAAVFAGLVMIWIGVLTGVWLSN